MKKLILAAAVATTLLAPQAFAQSKNFEGFSVGVSANFNSAKTEITGTGSFSENSTTGALKAGYGFGLSDKVALGLGLSYDLGKIKAGTTATNVSSVAKETTVLFIEPGYKVSNDMLVYAKLGYASVKGELENFTPAASDTYTGTAYGIGLRGMLAKNWSADVELVQMDFDKKRSAGAGTDIKPSITMLSVGVNYHF